MEKNKQKKRKWQEMTIMLSGEDHCDLCSKVFDTNEYNIYECNGCGRTICEDCLKDTKYRLCCECTKDSQEPK